MLVHGAIRDLDPGVELTAYRIVQEALTNARRHAPAAAVDVDYTATTYGSEYATTVPDRHPAQPADTA